jgi:hypothetical protein
MIPKKYILWTFLAFVALAMLTGIAAVLLPRGWVDDEVMITILIVGLYALGGLIVVVLGGISKPDGRKQRWTLRISTAALFISMGLFITGIWVGWRLDDYFLRPGAIALTIGTTLVHRLIVCPLSCNLLWFKLSKRTALIAGAITGAIIVFAFANDGFGNYNNFMGRVLAVFAIITAGSTIATGALAFFAPKPGEDEQSSYDTSLPIQIICPRCHASVKAQSNKETRCQECKLSIRVEIKEPRCTCGYLLYQLNSKACPECGKAVPNEEQWGSSEKSTASTAAQSASDDQNQTPSS